MIKTVERNNENECLKLDKKIDEFEQNTLWKIKDYEALLAQRPRLTLWVPGEIPDARGFETASLKKLSADLMTLFLARTDAIEEPDCPL